MYALSLSGSWKGYPLPFEKGQGIPFGGTFYDSKGLLGSDCTCMGASQFGASNPY